MIWLVTFTAVVLTDVDLGLLIGVGFSLLTVVFRTQRLVRPSKVIGLTVFKFSRFKFVLLTSILTN